MAGNVLNDRLNLQTALGRGTRLGPNQPSTLPSFLEKMNKRAKTLQSLKTNKMFAPLKHIQEQAFWHASAIGLGAAD